MKRHFRLLVALFVSMTVLVSDFSISMAYEKEIKTISSSIAESVTAAGKKTVAVVDFTDLQGNVTELGRFLAEEISVDMTIAAKGFEVIDRTHLNSVMKEHELSMLGITDSKKIKKLGEVAGVDAIVTGSVTPFGDSIRITCKVIATDTARTIGASKGDIAKTKAIEELMATGINTAENAASTESAASNTPMKKEAKPNQIIEANKFIFELQGCKATDKLVTCSFLITNKGDDRELFFGDFSNTKLFDDSGNQYELKTVQLSSKRESVSGVKSFLVSGISVKAALVFEVVSSQIRRIALLEIGNGDDASSANGEAIFMANCAKCHGQNGQGLKGVAPALNNTTFIRNSKKDAIAAVIENGRAGGAKKYEKFPLDMPKLGLSDDEISAVISFIKPMGSTIRFRDIPLNR